LARIHAAHIDDDADACHNRHEHAGHVRRPNERHIAS
jgi:hypothetical protein